MTTTTIEPRGPFSLRESATLGFGHRHDIGYDGVMRMAFCLDSYAESWARNMAKKQRMYHQELGPILSKCKLSQVGENIAFGYPSGKAVTKAWIASPPHKANLLNKRHRLIGVGAVQDSRGYWWVSEVLGRSR